MRRTFQRDLKPQFRHLLLVIGQKQVRIEYAEVELRITTEGEFRIDNAQLAVSRTKQTSGKKIAVN